MAKSVTIRMYNAGFGDAFLIRIPGKPRERRILIDCGSIKANGQSMDEVVKQILEDTKGRDGVPRIDLVIATHRHRDHVLGFEKAGWDKVHVGEVWMPWTEHPTDPKARRIREKQSGLAMALTKRLQMRLSAAGNGEKASLGASLEMALNALSNEKAMAVLHGGFAGDAKRRFLPEENTATEPLTHPDLKGVKFYVLGPSRDPEVIRDMEPPRGESYLALHGERDGTHTAPEPFGDEWRRYAPNAPTEMVDPDTKATLQSLGDQDAAVAVSLDKAVNGTSLLLVIQIGKAHLLFPGDAQWGTWNAAMKIPQWQVLLKKTKFYKVGHHGSHNATPLAFVEHYLPDNVTAMVPVVPYEQWEDIPRGPLLERLGEKSAHIARSDKPDEAPARPFPVRNNRYIEARITT